MTRSRSDPARRQESSPAVGRTRRLLVGGTRVLEPVGPPGLLLGEGLAERLEGPEAGHVPGTAEAGRGLGAQVAHAHGHQLPRAGER